jgi:hypothetical protein
MKITNARTAFAASLLLLGAWMQPAFAHSGGGHGGGGGGGGHSFGGGGGHSFGGGGGHYSGGASHAGAAHFASRGYGGANYSAGYATRAPMSHYSGGASFGVSGRAAVATTAYAGRAGAIGGARYARPGAWGGGYWGGRYWPGVYYGAGFAWFLPVLPFGYATYWWNDVPYYYSNDAYYTWSPSADGYVATEPPPAAPANGESDAAAPTYSGPEQPAMPVQSGQPSGGDNIFAYPAQGQSATQQAADRQECTQWAASQAGSASGSPDYRRALVACFEGRGYSAQ